jgi:DNA-binding response OmpR family regulator
MPASVFDFQAIRDRLNQLEERQSFLRPTGPARILVVDDVETNVQCLTMMLEREYYLVSAAYDGFQALAQIQTEKPDIILLDIMMPGLDGFEVCRRIKADPATADIPVVMVTALSGVDDLVRGFEAGADDFITTPVNFVVLVARIRALLRRKRHHEHIRERALVDPLTGAFNRCYFDAHASRLAARCRAAQLAVLMGGVDVTEPRAADDFEATRGQIKELQRASRNQDCDGLHMSQEELSTLIDGFDGILTKIEKQHREELERCRSVLEQQVDRTAALLRSNQQLQRTLDVLRTSNNSTNDASKPVSFLRMAHVLRTPLNAIIGFSQLLKQVPFGPIGNKRYLEFVEVIDASATDLMANINDMLDLAKLESGKMELNAESIDVEQVVQDILRVNEHEARQREVTLTWLPSALKLPNLYCNLHSLREMLMSIIAGAIRSNKPGESVVISTDLSAGFTLVTQAPLLQSARRYLGFTLTNALVEWHGGHFSVDITPDVGTTARLSFPPERILPRSESSP